MAAYRADMARETRLAAPGRPSRLPPGVAPGTPDEVRALLTPGRRVLVDGYNVTIDRHEGQPLADQRSWLVRRLEGLAARYDVECSVVFDGDRAVPTTATQRLGGRVVKVRYTSGGEADDLLVDMVERLPPAEPVLVVTDDRELRERLEARGADVVGTAAFLAVAR